MNLRGYVRAGFPPSLEISAPLCAAWRNEDDMMQLPSSPIANAPALGEAYNLAECCSFGCQNDVGTKIQKSKLSASECDG